MGVHNLKTVMANRKQLARLRVRVEALSRMVNYVVYQIAILLPPPELLYGFGGVLRRPRACVVRHSCHWCYVRELISWCAHNKEICDTEVPHLRREAAPETNA